MQRSRARTERQGMRNANSRGEIALEGVYHRSQRRDPVAVKDLPHILSFLTRHLRRRQVDALAL